MAPVFFGVEFVPRHSSHEPLLMSISSSSLCVIIIAQELLRVDFGLEMAVRILSGFSPVPSSFSPTAPYIVLGEHHRLRQRDLFPELLFIFVGRLKRFSEVGCCLPGGTVHILQFFSSPLHAFVDSHSERMLRGTTSVRTNRLIDRLINVGPFNEITMKTEDEHD